MELMLVLMLVSSFSMSLGQFPLTDGTNDLFALFTQCPIEPRYPPENQYFCYRTNQRVVSGFTLCNPVFVRQRNISVADRTDTHTVYYINTPGRLRGANYVNRLLCRWNIRCPSGQLMYFDFPEHNIEQAVSSPFFVNPVCLDYLKVSRDFGDFLSCGTNTPAEDLEPSRLLIEFRSNRRRRRPGFRMRAICFDPTTQDGFGCTTATSKREAKEPKKLILEEVLTHKDHDIINKLIREKRNPQANRFILETIDVEAKVVYFTRTVTVLLKGEAIFTFPGVDSFHSLNEFDGVVSYYGDTLGNRTIALRGFGILFVIDNVAYYIIFGADPRFMPNGEEQRMIRTLLDAEETIVQDDDFIIQEDPGRRMKDHKGYGKRSANGQNGNSHQKRMASVFPSEVVAMAQSAQNSCNAVLRAAALSILNNL